MCIRDRHNPSTPGGIGVGVGVSVLLNEIDDSFINKDIIAPVSYTHLINFKINIFTFS